MNSGLKVWDLKSLYYGFLEFLSLDLFPVQWSFDKTRMCVSLLTHATRPIHPHKGLLMPLLSILVSDPQGHSNKHMHNCKMYIKSYVLIINLVRWWLKDIEEHVFKLSYGKGGYFPLFIREAISNNLFLIASCFLGGCFVVLLVCFLKKSFFRNVFSN